MSVLKHMNSLGRLAPSETMMDEIIFYNYLFFALFFGGSGFDRQDHYN